MVSVFLSLDSDGSNKPLVPNNDRVSIELKSLARITCLVLRVFRIALNP
jgi:hypothetical protein